MVKLKRTLALLPGGGSDVRLRATELMARKNLLNVKMTSILRRCHRLSSLNTAGGRRPGPAYPKREKRKERARIASLMAFFKSNDKNGFRIPFRRLP